MKFFRGFSLIELLVVISIIGLLVGIIVPNLSNARAASRDARRVSDIKNIQLALALYYNDNLHYPCHITTVTGTIGSCAPDFYPTYMATIPKDPKTPYTDYIYSSQQNTSATDNLTCNNKTVVYYHLGAVMETSSFTTNQDDDKTTAQQTGYACSASNGGARFDGNASACVGGSAASSGDDCFDVVPN
ncbi:MAG: prepilin-type N-terminal cleavage/methylation domain-containing protein [Patescibacteria group bacterium]